MVDSTPKTATHPRVFLGLSEVAGYYSALASGMQEMGVPADLITLHNHRFAYGDAATTPGAQRVQRLIRRVRRRGPGRRPLALLGEGILRFVLMCWAVARYDVFIFGWGNSFFHGHDLWLLRRLGKTVVCVFHGSDSRPCYMNGAMIDELTTAQLAKRSRSQFRLVSRVERSADVVVCNPLSAQFHRRRIVPPQVIGLPASASPEPAAWPASSPVRLLHAPSKPAAKGTDRIRAAVDALRAGGRDVEYVEIVGRPNAEVQEAIGHCHLVLDQLFSDTLMAGFGTEAAAHGRVAMIGGYGLGVLPSVLPPEAIAPAIVCDPEDPLPALLAAVSDLEALRSAGAEAHAFVSREWPARQVAARFLQLAAGEAPDTWWVDPQQEVYLCGAAASIDTIREASRHLIADHGPAALHLDHWPECRDRFVEFVSGDQR